MLSLSPRYDLFRFSFPKDFLPKEVEAKYTALFNKKPGVIMTAIDYLNESIQTVSIPGITDINMQQPQHSYNTIERDGGRINVEPTTNINYTSPGNPLAKIGNEIQVTFRMNQGLYNYFMLYETIFHRICKPYDVGPDPVLYIELLNESGNVVAKISFFDVYINGIDGLEFSYNKMERDTGTFSISLVFNNIDFDFVK